MIYITGDVHHTLKGNWDQENSGDELDASLEYLTILKKYKIPSTLFVNGICFKHSVDKINRIKKFDVELGGHTYDNFGSMNVFKSYIYRKLFGCVYGPSWYQERDIKKTKKAFENVGLKMTSWRTHAFASNEKTFEILEKEEVEFVSDLVGEIRPFKKDGLLHLPINIPVDQNTISFGELKPENRDPFASCTKGRISCEEWFGIIEKRITKNEKENRDSILLLHPITMKSIDNFQTFEKIAKFVSKYQCKKTSDFRFKGV